MSKHQRVGRHQKQRTFLRQATDEGLKDYTKPNQGRRAAR